MIPIDDTKHKWFLPIPSTVASSLPSVRDALLNRNLLVTNMWLDGMENGKVLILPITVNVGANVITINATINSLITCKCVRVSEPHRAMNAR
ncbi:unnamed protein product, partial [Ceratitis capitata]